MRISDWSSDVCSSDLPRGSSTHAFMILREKSSMADTGAITLARAAANDLLIEGADVRLAAEARLGIAKLQIRAANPAAWFEQALGIAPPPVLTQIQHGPVPFALRAPGAWLRQGARAP